MAQQTTNSPDLRTSDSATPPRRRRRITRRQRVVAAVVTVAALAVPGVSYGQALVYPGSAPLSVRTVEWVRDHGGSPVVDAAENFWYSHHVPTGAAPIVTAGGATNVSAAARAATVGPTPVTVQASLPGTMAGEGAWVPGRVAADGRPALYTTFFRPDASHLGVVAGAAWMRAGSYTAHLVAGTRQPDGNAWPGGSSVASGDVNQLLATFNAGFKFKDTPGGFLLDGRTSRPLESGLATAVIDDTGRLSVGALGSGVQITSHIVAARQNLHMIVEAGRPVPGLASDAGGRWGTARNQSQFTWRSALGTDAHGDLVYVAGNGLDLVHLADALTAAGAVQGMELDMHQGMVSFSSWTPNATGSAAVPTKLLPDMTREADRYLASDQRDFFYLTTRAL